MCASRHPKYAPFNSDFLSITFDKDYGKIAFIGIESGGRDRDKHASYNLALPSYGGTPGAFKNKAPLKDCIVETDNSIFFKNQDGASSLFKIEERAFDCTFTKAPKNNIFNIRFSIKIAPPTIWSESVTKKDAPKRLKSSDPLVFSKYNYKLPITIHFPDFGMLKIEASSPDVYCVEELLKSAEFTGIALGNSNFDPCHNTMNALHFGSSSLTFKTKGDAENVNLKFTVIDEVYPKLPFEVENTHDWDGLRRCWMNSFALNRDFFDMGDNIYLPGIAHLSVSMKSDLLQVMGEDNEYFKMVRKVFERQMLNSFLKAQADDGEINFSYYYRKKGKQPMCEFIDSTPGAVIATAGISHWNMPFAKKLIPYAMKAADFILTLDTDSDGIFEVPFSGNFLDDKVEYGDRQRNWWDNFAFGHKDIYFNYLCHRALRELSELLKKVGMGEKAEKYKSQLEKFNANFFKTFYNPETEVMVGWISRDGKKHDYMFTFAVSMGIDEGLIPKDEGKKMLKILLKEMEKKGYRDLRFGIPGNLISVPVPDTFDWPCMTDWGHYENGGLSGMNGFHFLTSMYKVGLNKEADAIFKAILNTYEKDMTHTGLMPGYAQSVDWRTIDGVGCGYNYLADNYYFLLAAYTGKGKVKHPAVVK